MDITIAQTAGFCMGVKRAIELALEASRQYRLPIYTCGPLIHNPHVLEMLQKNNIMQLKDLDQIDQGILLIRAHGISPEHRQHLEEKGLIIIDGTCPRVQRIHHQISKYIQKNYDIVIYGDPDHAEVTGLLGSAGERGRLVSSIEDAEQLPSFTGPVLFVAQTTQSRQQFEQIKAVLEQRNNKLVVIDTLCATTEARQAEVLRLAQDNDAVVVVGGKNSANTVRLVELTRQASKIAFHVETEEDLPDPLPESIRKIAVTAGASTPNWMIERVIDRLERMKKEITLKKTLVDLVKWSTESFALVALGSASLALTCSYYLFRTFDLIPIIVAASYVLSMHILNHYADRKSVLINEPLREEVFRRHQNVFIALGIGAGFIALSLTFFLGKTASLLVLFAVATGAVYSVRIVPHSLTRMTRYQRLKEIPASKDFVVALAWSSVTVFVPFFSRYSSDSYPQLLTVWLMAFFLVYIRTVLLDIKDIQGDRIVGKETLPIILGEKKTLTFMKILLGLETALIVLGSMSGLLPRPALFQILSLTPILLVILYYKKGPLTRRYRFQALLDISFVSSGIITLLSLL